MAWSRRLVCSRQARIGPKEKPRGKFGATGDTELAIKSSNIIVQRCPAHTQACGRLLLAVALQKTEDCLPKPGRQVRGTGLTDGRQHGAYQGANLLMKQPQEFARPSVEMPLTSRPAQRNPNGLALTGNWLGREHGVIQVRRGEVLAIQGRTAPFTVVEMVAEGAAFSTHG
jgi:hypothetical protein